MVWNSDRMLSKQCELEYVMQYIRLCEHPQLQVMHSIKPITSLADLLRPALGREITTRQLKLSGKKHPFSPSQTVFFPIINGKIVKAAIITVVCDLQSNCGSLYLLCQFEKTHWMCFTNWAMTHLRCGDSGECWMQSESNFHMNVCVFAVLFHSWFKLYAIYEVFHLQPWTLCCVALSWDQSAGAQDVL